MTLPASPNAISLGLISTEFGPDQAVSSGGTFVRAGNIIVNGVISTSGVINLWSINGSVIMSPGSSLTSTANSVNIRAGKNILITTVVAATTVRIVSDTAGALSVLRRQGSADSSAAVRWIQKGLGTDPATHGTTVALVNTPIVQLISGASTSVVTMSSATLTQSFSTQPIVIQDGYKQLYVRLVGGGGGGGGGTASFDEGRMASGGGGGGGYSTYTVTDAVYGAVYSAYVGAGGAGRAASAGNRAGTTDATNTISVTRGFDGAASYLNSPAGAQLVAAAGGGGNPGVLWKFEGGNSGSPPISAGIGAGNVANGELGTLNSTSTQYLGGHGGNSGANTYGIPGVGGRGGGVSNADPWDGNWDPYALLATNGTGYGAGGGGGAAGFNQAGSPGGGNGSNGVVMYELTNPNVGTIFSSGGSKILITTGAVTLEAYSSPETYFDSLGAATNTALPISNYYAGATAGYVPSGTLGFPGGVQTPIPPAFTPQVLTGKVAIFGDSVSTYGGLILTGGADPTLESSYTQSQTGSILSTIQALYVPTYQVINISRGGMTTDEALTGVQNYVGPGLPNPFGASGTITQWILDNDPTKIILRYGLADAILINNSTTTLNNLQTIIDFAVGQGIEVILIGVNPAAADGDPANCGYYPGAMTTARESTAAAINSGIVSKATAQGLKYANPRAVLTKPACSLPDGIHPFLSFGTVITETISGQLKAQIPPIELATPAPLKFGNFHGAAAGSAGIEYTWMEPGTEYQWTIPAGINSVPILVVGGGGRGGNATKTIVDASFAYGGGGGGGEVVYIPSQSLTPGTTATIKVGNKGTFALGQGTSSSFIVGAVSIVGQGGINGAGGADSNGGAGGNSGSGFQGGAGASGGGGGGAGDSEDGADWNGAPLGGSGGAGTAVSFNGTTYYLGGGGYAGDSDDEYGGLYGVGLTPTGGSGAGGIGALRNIKGTTQGFDGAAGMVKAIGPTPTVQLYATTQVINSEDSYVGTVGSANAYVYIWFYDDGRMYIQSNDIVGPGVTESSQYGAWLTSSPAAVSTSISALYDIELNYVSGRNNGSFSIGGSTTGISTGTGWGQRLNMGVSNPYRYLSLITDGGGNNSAVADVTFNATIYNVGTNNVLASTDFTISLQTFTEV